MTPPRTRAEHIAWSCAGALLFEALGKPLTEVAACLVYDLSKHDATVEAARLTHGALDHAVRQRDRGAVRLFVQGMWQGARQAQAQDQAGAWR